MTNTSMSDTPMSDTPLLALPLLAAAQSQKHVTHNDALLALDALVHLSVAQGAALAPPEVATPGQRLRIGAGASGAFAGRDGQIASFELGGWRYFTPQEGWTCWVEDAATLDMWRGGAWRAALDGVIGRLGLNAAASDAQRLAVASQSALFTHPPESGSHRIYVNKAGSGDVASAVFETGYVGHAELGLCGDDAFALKVSADGAAWRQAFVCDAATGLVSFAEPVAAPNLLINPDFSVNQRQFSGGALAAGAYGFDRWRAAGAASLRRTGAVITLSGGVEQVIETPAGLGAHVVVCAHGASGGELRATLGGVEKRLKPDGDRAWAAFERAEGWPAALTLKIAAEAEAASFFAVTCAEGGRPAPWRARPPALELTLCRRYFQIMRGGVMMLSWGAGSAAGYFSLPAEMRVAPRPWLDGAATIFVFGVGITSVTAANISTLTMETPTTVNLAFSSGSAAMAANQPGFLVDARLCFDAEL
jgi:hypothetical protein